MDIGCACICNYDGEIPEFCNTRYVTAKKEHICYECDETIKVGDKYEYTFGKWDGYVNEFKTCITCVKIRTDVCCDTWVFGSLRNDIWETYGVDYVTGETKDDKE